jgi:hypothetical protein
LINRELQASFIYSTAHGGISLWIKIYQQGALSLRGKRSGQVDRRSGFSYPALLIGYGKYMHRSGPFL